MRAPQRERRELGLRAMRILLVGAGGVGSAAVSDRQPDGSSSTRSSWPTTTPPALQRAAAVGDARISASTVDASSAEAITALCREHAITHVLNAVDPRFVMPIFNGAFAAGADYLDMAMSLSRPHQKRPYEKCGVKLGDEQFAAADRWEIGRAAGAGRDRRRARTLRCVRPLRRGRAVLVH